MDLIDRAVKDGWDHRRVCRALELGCRRAWRWRTRRAGGGLEDLPAGGQPVHGLLDWEAAEIVKLFDEWAEVDRSHRKLAHRGSYLHRVWVSPSSVRRVLAAHGLRLRRPPRPGRSQRRPFPAWVTYTKQQIWIYDTTHFRGCPDVAATMIIGLRCLRMLQPLGSRKPPG
ncbi:MAG: hypothetical protein ACRDYX_20920 [Egibacteraceae bacterium]